MTMRHAPSVIAAGLAIAVGSIACGGTKPDAEPARAVSIAMERTPCFGSCPVYRVELDSSGKVVYEGRGFVKERGRRETTIPAADVQALAKEIEAAGFFTLRDTYPPDASDHASVITLVTIDGKSKRIEHDLSASKAPAVLEGLYRRIDDVARSKQWVGDGAQPPRPGEKGGGPDTARKDTTRR